MEGFGFSWKSRHLHPYCWAHGERTSDMSICWRFRPSFTCLLYFSFLPLQLMPLIYTRLLNYRDSLASPIRFTFCGTSSGRPRGIQINRLECNFFLGCCRRAAVGPIGNKVGRDLTSRSWNAFHSASSCTKSWCVLPSYKRISMQHIWILSNAVIIYYESPL